MSIEDNKNSFLTYELGVLSLKAALSTRVKNWPVYAKNHKENQKNSVKSALRQELESLTTTYAIGNITEEAHLFLISAFADRISLQYGPLLYKEKLRHGVAQKLINVHLKYLWAAGVIAEPPHCPIDGIIRDLAGLSYDWVSSDSAEEYENAIATLKEHAEPYTLAEWEIRVFRRRAQA